MKAYQRVAVMMASLFPDSKYMVPSPFRKRNVGKEYKNRPDYKVHRSKAERKKAKENSNE
jgi:hypothetical protein